MFHWLLPLLRVILGMVVGAALALLLAWQAIVVGMIHGMAACFLFCVVGVLLFLAVLPVHELGHALAGWAVGLPFARLTAGPVTVAREGGRLRARLKASWFQPAASVTHEPVWGGDGLLRWAVMVLGGPLANLVLGVGWLVAANWLNPGPGGVAPRAAQAGWGSVALLLPGSLLIACFNVAGMLNLAWAFGTLLPGDEAGVRTDGGRVLDLWRLHRAARAIGCPVTAALFVASALAEVSGGRRKRQWAGSAREFCDFLLAARGEETAAVLRSCGLRRSEDVGRVMFGLVEAGLARRPGSGSEDDFRGLFALE
jgi:hypothetical protein